MAIPLPKLEALLASLRLHGVTRFQCGEWSVEMGAPFGITGETKSLPKETDRERDERLKKEEEALLYASAGG